MTQNEQRRQLRRAMELLDRAERQSQYAATILRRVDHDAATARLMLERLTSTSTEDS